MSGDNIGIIYGLICPITNNIRYVGQTTQKLNNRFIQHKTCSIKSKTHLGNWLRKLKVLNLLNSLEIVILDKCSTDSLIERETYYINFYILKGCNLVNEAIRDIQTNRLVLTEKQKQRRRDIAIEVHTGRKRSEETRKNLAKARKLYLANNNNPNLGRKIGEETKKLMSDKKPKIKVCSLDFHGNIIKYYDSINAVKTDGLSVGNVANCIKNKQSTYKNSFWRVLEAPYITKDHISNSVLFVLLNTVTCEVVIDYPKNLATLLNISRYRIYRAAAEGKVVLHKYKIINNISKSEIELEFILKSIGEIE